MALGIAAKAILGMAAAAALAGPISSAMAADAPAPPPAAPPSRPNVILIITDDQRWDILGSVQKEQGKHAQFPGLRTPNLDRLAAEGARFRNAFVVHSLCSPSRATMLTGLYSHQHSVVDNGRPLPVGTRPNWAVSLRDAGYQTAYFGKWHMSHQPERPGFSTIFSYVGQGIYDNCVFLDDGKPVTTTGWVDDVTSQHAADFIRQHAAEAFAMVVGFKAPHAPRKPPARWATEYSDMLFEPPASANIMPPFRLESGFVLKPWNPVSEDKRNYMRCVSAADDGVGVILKALDEQKLAENTMVIFVGDNGFFLGEHTMGDKRLAYDESLRIPMLLRYPRMVKPGTVVDKMVLNLDIAPTVLEMAGQAIPKEMPGKSWTPLLTDPQAARASWRTSFVYENFADPDYPSVTYDMVALRTEQYKLIRYEGRPQWTEFFDLRNDPNETVNLAANPGYAKMMQQLSGKLEMGLHHLGYYGAPTTNPTHRFETAEPEEAKH